jgi:hypothetical protein
MQPPASAPLPTSVKTNKNREFTQRDGTVLRIYEVGETAVSRGRHAEGRVTVWQTDGEEFVFILSIT